MTALSRAIDAADGILSISVGIDFGSLPAPVTIDSENLLVTAGDNARTIHVERGLNGTAAAPHSLGATITQGWGGGGSGGVTPTLAEVLAEGNDGDPDVLISGANAALDSDGTGGDIVLGAGAGDGLNAGGNVQLNAGTGGLTGSGGYVGLAAGYSGDGAAGAAVTAQAGNAGGLGGAAIVGSGAAGSGTDADGGDIILYPGAGDGAGRNGLVFLNLPTADPLVAGALWSDAGVVTVSAG